MKVFGRLSEGLFIAAGFLMIYIEYILIAKTLK